VEFVVDVLDFLIPAGAAGQTFSVLFAGWTSTTNLGNAGRGKV